MPYRKKRTPFRFIYRKPIHTLEKILDWADAHYERTGDWPKLTSGPIFGPFDENWCPVNACLYQGHRGLPGGSSLALLLLEHRQRRSLGHLPPLTIDDILTWADSHHDSTGKWPTENSGPILDAPGETWSAVALSLYGGNRGLPGGSSLPQLLAAERGVPPRAPPLNIEDILCWADAHHQRTGYWPNDESGPIPEAANTSWMNVNEGLRLGWRSLPGGSSLAHLLATKRGVRIKKHRPPLTIARILAWADLHHQRTGRWPAAKTGAIADSPGETWLAVETALRVGTRSLPGGSSLALLLAERRGHRHHLQMPPLTETRILQWADAHKQRTGDWPTEHSGSVAEADHGETWGAIAAALNAAGRGFAAAVPWRTCWHGAGEDETSGTYRA